MNETDQHTDRHSERQRQKWTGRQTQVKLKFGQYKFPRLHLIRAEGEDSGGNIVTEPIQPDIEASGLQKLYLSRISSSYLMNLVSILVPYRYVHNFLPPLVNDKYLLKCAPANTHCRCTLQWIVNTLAWTLKGLGVCMRWCYLARPLHLKEFSILFLKFTCSEAAREREIMWIVSSLYRLF